MLVLSRRANESVYIGESIKVTVVRVRGNVISLGIEAPKSIRVMREEIIDRPQTQATAEQTPQQSAEGQSKNTPAVDRSDEADAPLADLDDMLYEPEDYAIELASFSPLAQYMFAP